MRVRGILLACFLLAAPAMATAQPVQGLHFSTGFGLHIPQDPGVSALSPSLGTGRLTLNEAYGFSALASLGYGLGNGFRFEVEGNIARSGIRQLTGTPFPTASDQGVARNWGVMANAIFDMDVGSAWVYPYLGVGAGYQWTTINNFAVAQVGGPLGLNISDTAGGFAWQAIVGASFPIPRLPGLSATVDYRFMDILGGEKFYGTQTVAGASSPAGIKLRNQFSHDLIFGVRYAFNAPPPPMPPTASTAPAPVAAASRTYLVYFDWDRATLTDRARQIIREAAENSTRIQHTRIEVSGYTDSSGAPENNQALSIRRAQAVAGELVRNGVPRDAIAAQGFGESNPLVPAGPNAREAQNRRVEIIIR